MLTVDQVADRLGLTRKSVYRRSKDWDFVVRYGRKAMRFDENRLDKWIERHRGTERDNGEQ